jgi:lysophospholipase L1-like esterase
MDSCFKLDDAGPDYRLAPADSSSLLYSGRFDRSVPAHPVIVWQGSTIRARFRARRIGFALSSAWGQNFFTINIDGNLYRLKADILGAHYYLLQTELTPGEHELTLFKQSEASISNVVFDGLVLDGEGELLPAPESHQRRIEFYGDSITAGACDEDPGDDQWDDYSTHNNYLAYGALAARELGLDYVCTAVSGTGLCHSFNPIFMAEVWDKIYPDKSARAYDFPSQLEPDIIVINLGQNDFAYPRSLGLPFPADFAGRYVNLVRAIRERNQHARILCAIGGMDAWTESAEFRAAWTQATNALQTNDGNLRALRFEAYSPRHPRVDVQAAMAKELVAFLRDSGWLRSSC